MKSNHPYQALLLQPPPGDVTGPYPALCYLKSYAAGKGYRVKVKDLGIEALHYLVQPERVVAMLERVRQKCGRLEALPTLDIEKQRHYAGLLAALSSASQPAWFANCLDLFQRPGTFFDYRRYKQARSGLDGFFGLLSALHTPTVLTAAEYPTATQLKTMDAILAHIEPAVNPYIQYYEAVLFPMIAEQRPPLVGISMVFANQSVQALVLGHMIKTRFPGIHVALGGAYLSQWAMTMDDSQIEQILACCDTIVCGEGEQALIDLLEHVLADKSPAGLPNLICRDAAAGHVIRFDQLNYTDIAIQAPPDFSDLDLAAYLAPQTILPYCISRGCYWGRCVFCQNRYGDHRTRRYQTVPVDKALAEMARLADQYGSNHFNFSNDVIDPPYLKRLSREIIDRGLSFIWNTDLRAETAFDEQTCQLMARAGLNSVAIGFESGCQKTLDAMDKGKQVETIGQVMKYLYRSGVATQAMGIFGMPGETEADGEQTVVFLEDNQDYISYYVIGLLMVLPGSRMYREPDAHGVTAISYTHNPLKTPEPVWMSATRMSIQSVNRLYARLNHLEEIYAINEYPYVGGLSTNHGFLYYTLGPEILKRLRRDERNALAQYHHRLGIDGSSPELKAFKTLVPSWVVPQNRHRSRYPMHRMTAEVNGQGNPTNVIPGTENTFLLLPDHGRQAPLLVEAAAIRLINRIDGKRSLAAVLKKIKGPELKRALSLIWYLYLAGAIDFDPKEKQ
jgi:anaerobic magnesium-protoporphyrin IX monomethyl ester cyclase